MADSTLKIIAVWIHNVYVPQATTETMANTVAL